MRHNRWNQQGLSLIEIMVALTLSLILTLGLVHIFTANSQSFRMAEASARLQESGRMALGILSREIRNADYWGCLRDPSALNSILNSDGFDVSSLMRGLDAENGTGPDGSDVLILGGAGGTSNSRVQFVPNVGAATMQVDDVSEISRGDILIVTNCIAGDILQVSNNPSATSSLQVNHATGNSQGPPGNSTSTLSFDYPKDPNGGEIFKPKQQRFYLRDIDGRRELVTDGVNVQGGTSGVGLYSNPVALLEDVMNFQLQFGVDSNGDGRVNNWSDPGGLDVSGQSLADSAIAVRLSLLVRSPQGNVTSGGQSYCFPGWLDCESDASNLTTASADDRFLYRVYTSTATLRNRTN